MQHRAALVPFSEGHDSTTYLAWALERYERVETTGLHYGQRHAVEMDAGLEFCDSCARLFRSGMQS